MKHARMDYDRIQDPDSKIPGGEPVFLLRGQDICAPAAVRFWAGLFEADGGDPVVAQAARAQADLMESWPIRKLADIPPGVGILTVTKLPLDPEAKSDADQGS